MTLLVPKTRWSPTADAVLAALARGPATAPAVANLIDRRGSNVITILYQLEERGQVQRTGEKIGKAVIWRLPITEPERAGAADGPAVSRHPYRQADTPEPLDLAAARALLEDAGYQVSLLPRKLVVAL